MTAFEKLEAMILSGQVPEPDALHLLDTVPGFRRWYMARAADRQAA